MRSRVCFVVFEVESHFWFVVVGKQNNEVCLLWWEPWCPIIVDMQIWRNMLLRVANGFSDKLLYMNIEFNGRSLYLICSTSLLLVCWVHNWKYVLVCIVSGSELEFISLSPVRHFSNGFYCLFWGHANDPGLLPWRMGMGCFVWKAVSGNEKVHSV